MEEEESLPVYGKDLHDLRKSGLTDETIWENGLYTTKDYVELATILNQLPERPPKQHKDFIRGGGLVIPYTDLQGRKGFARVKPHVPRIRKGKPVKYEQPRGEKPRPYFPKSSRPRLRGKAKCNVYVTEGEKKALALSQLGLVAIGLCGFWGWKRNGVVIEDLAAVPWKGRKVFIVFDYDLKRKTRRESAQSARELAKALRKAGAKEVYLVLLPADPDGGKMGVDDYLVKHGAEAFRALVEQARPVPTTAGVFSNFRVETIKDKEGTEKTVRVGLTVSEIHEQLSELLGTWPKRVGKLLFVADGNEVRWLENTTQTFAWIGAQLVEPVRWAVGVDKVSRDVFDAHLRFEAESFAAVEPLPHHPPLPGHYYTNPPLQGGDGKALAALLRRFQPASEIDRSLIRAAFLTPFWGGMPGARPAFLIESDDDDGEGGRGTGKSTLAKAIAHLAGRHMDVSPQDDFSRVVTRLLTPSALNKRVALLDNVKTLHFSWADLEGLITNDVINGHRMFVGDAERPNTLTWFITLNNASLSKDMAQRCNIVRVKRPDRDDTWEEETWRMIAENRWAIIRDILAALAGEHERLEDLSRWAAWEQQVLACVPDAATCQQEIARRQAAVDGDQEEADLVRDAFVALLRTRKHDPDRDIVFVPAAEAARIVEEATGESRAKQRATVYLQTLPIRELRKVQRKDLGGRGWVWTGRKSGPRQSAVMLRPLTWKGC
jgi:hypothetical protein